jgi:ribokinase
MLAMLLRTGVQGVILKRGALGCVLVGSDGVAHNLPAYKVRAVDTTAAGDAFNAAFAVGLLLGYGFVESARFATAAASISVTRSGAQPSLATRKEVLLALECVNQEENSSERKEQLGMA